MLDGRPPPILHGNSIKAIAAELPAPKTHEKADILLSSLGKLFPRPGNALQYNGTDAYSLACAADDVEAGFYFKSLIDRGFVDAGGSVRITLSGWERIANLSTMSLQSKRAFVAFKFSEEMLTAWTDSFGAAIKDAGFDPVASNFPDHNERIDAKIVTEIKQSKFLVADVTGANTGVYFEAGLAIGLGKPVIWTCRRNQMEDMHFDTKQYNHILWRDHADLREQLYYRIVATI